MLNWRIYKLGEKYFKCFNKTIKIKRTFLCYYVISDFVLFVGPYF